MPAPGPKGFGTEASPQPEIQTTDQSRTEGARRRRIRRFPSIFAVITRIVRGCQEGHPVSAALRPRQLITLSTEAGGFLYPTRRKILLVTRERLTRHEITWLLAQEARGAAKTLRDEVQGTRGEPTLSEPRLQPVESTLDALDGAIEMLSALNTGQRGKGARRGRIDLAALLYEIAPNARISIAPGAGTEVLGDEAELRRMLSVLVTQASAGGADETEVQILRQGDWIKICVELGPDVAAGGELERRWLARMALRHGGRVELEGGTQSVFLQADGASDQREVTELRKELQQAQRLGEAYARELATMLASGDFRTEPPPPPGLLDGQRLATLRAACGALERPVRSLAGAMREDLTLVPATPEANPLGQLLSRRSQAASELASELASISECTLDEVSSEIVIGDELELAEGALASRAKREGVTLSIQCPASLIWRGPRSPVRLLIRMLLVHAVSATPRGGRVHVEANATERGLVLTVEDGGPAVPISVGRAMIRHEADPSSFGRPQGIALLAADAISDALGGELILKPGPTGCAETRVTLPCPP